MLEHRLRRSFSLCDPVEENHRAWLLDPDHTIPACRHLQRSCKAGIFDFWLGGANGGRPQQRHHAANGLQVFNLFAHPRPRIFQPSYSFAQNVPEEKGRLGRDYTVPSDNVSEGFELNS